MPLRCSASSSASSPSAAAAPPVANTAADTDDAGALDLQQPACKRELLSRFADSGELQPVRKKRVPETFLHLRESHSKYYRYY